MALINYKEKTPTRRFASKITRPANNGISPRSLKTILPKKSGRSFGKITVRHQGGRHKRLYRNIDFKRDKFGILGEIVSLEYDPNRNVDIALVKYPDGDYRYILAPQGLKIGDKVEAGEKVEARTGNAMRIANLPVGAVVHNVELTPGKGGQIGRSAGTRLVLQAKEPPYGHLKMPSGEIRMIPLKSMATVGVLGNEEWKNITLGKAGRSRHMGRRPAVRGVAMDPGSHAHGGGEGRSPIGRKRPMTYYGKSAVGNTRRSRSSDKLIIKRRK